MRKAINQIQICLEGRKREKSYDERQHKRRRERQKESVTEKIE